MAPFFPYQGKRITAEIVQTRPQAGSLCHYRQQQRSLIIIWSFVPEFGFVAQSFQPMGDSLERMSHQEKAARAIRSDPAAPVVGGCLNQWDRRPCLSMTRELLLSLAPPLSMEMLARC